MEDGVPRDNAACNTGPPPGSPPPPPDPNVDDATAATVETCDDQRIKSDEPWTLESEQWDITSISAMGTVRMLADALSTLAEATGDVPPTPPVSRPTTPKKLEEPPQRHRRTPSSLQKASGVGDFGSVNIGSPEAHPHEPITIEHGAYAEDITLQQAAIARRFFSKIAPPFTVEQYLLRLHKFCPHSPGVYLTAAVYVHQLCVIGLSVPATSKTIHRLALAAIRVAAKAVEDNKWAQERVAKVGGVTLTQLKNLEIALCFLIDFELWVDAAVLARRTFQLQQAARHNLGAKGRLGQHFKLRLPLRRKVTG